MVHQITVLASLPKQTAERSKERIAGYLEKLTRGYRKDIRDHFSVSADGNGGAVIRFLASDCEMETARGQIRTFISNLGGVAREINNRKHPLYADDGTPMTLESIGGKLEFAANVLV